MQHGTLGRNTQQSPAAEALESSMSLSPGALQILLVEDDDDHAEIVARCLKANRVMNELRRVTDGEAALDYLFRKGPYADPALSPRPSLILLDLRLPKVDGLEVLRIIKESNYLRPIPVVMLTTSDTERDITAAYQFHANSYLVKPVDFNEFTEMMQALSCYWGAWNRSPFNEKEG
jgi:CheY-like chemotaxis protein